MFKYGKNKMRALNNFCKEVKILDINKVWEEVLENVKNTVSTQVGYNVHVKSSVPVSATESVFTIRVPITINRNMIQFRYKDCIESALEKVTGKKYNLKVLVIGENEDEEEKLPVSDTVNPKYTFENFVVGSSNEYAAATAISTAENPGYIYNPLFIYGNSGLGKTHLMHAIGNKIIHNNPRLKVLYVTSEHFTNDFINALKDKKMSEFKTNYRTVDVLLIDDIQFLHNKEGIQEEFFHTFNDLYSMNKQIVITSDRKPSELKNLEERLVTRFSQGLPIDVNVPNFETRMAILKKKAEMQGISINEDVLSYIADRIKSNIRELEGALLKIISMSEMSHREMNVELAEYVIKSILPEDGIVKITPNKIMDKVSVFYNITKDDLMGKIKTKNVAFPRQIAMYLCYKLTDMNYTTIGKAIGNKDRTTVMYNVDKIEKEISHNESLKEDINCIIKDLQSI